MQNLHSLEGAPSVGIQDVRFINSKFCFNFGIIYSMYSKISSVMMWWKQDKLTKLNILENIDSQLNDNFIDFNIFG